MKKFLKRFSGGIINKLFLLILITVLLCAVVFFSITGYQNKMLSDLNIETSNRLFVYTDGVPEATNADKELFGTDRMLTALNEVKDAPPEDVLKGVRQSVDAFVKDAEQFDDLTMLCLTYKGSRPSA